MWNSKVRRVIIILNCYKRYDQLKTPFTGSELVVGWYNRITENHICEQSAPECRLNGYITPRFKSGLQIPDSLTVATFGVSSVIYPLPLVAVLRPFV